jgi:hypothetical protein
LRGYEIAEHIAIMFHICKITLQAAIKVGIHTTPFSFPIYR